MKKIFFTIFTVVALTLVSCERGIDIMNLDANQFDNTEFKCWKFTIKNAGLLNGTMYAWDTEHNVICTLQAAYLASGKKAVVSYEATPENDKESCHAMNTWDD